MFCNKSIKNERKRISNILWDILSFPMYHQKHCIYCRCADKPCENSTEIWEKAISDTMRLAISLGSGKEKFDVLNVSITDKK